MSESFRKSGIHFLKSLGRHAELILDTYVEGVVPSHYEDDGKAIDALIQQQVLWRPDDHEGLHLTRSVRGLLEQALKDERNRQIDLNIGSSIAVIKTLIGHYKEAQAKGNYRDAAAYSRDIGETVFTIIESLRGNVRSLWHHINNEFGLVGTLSAKIRENELAKQQVEFILNGLEMFDFQELSELSGINAQLRRLLVVNLQRTVSSCSTELQSVQNRLRYMMTHFKEAQARSDLIRGYLVFSDNHPEFQPACYPEQSALPVLFNQLEPLMIKGLLDVTIEDHDGDLLAIAQTVTRQDSTKTTEVLIASGPLIFEAMTEVSVQDKPERIAVDAFFCHSLDRRGAKLSALDYYYAHALNLTWSDELWLFAVIGYYFEMDSAARSLFGHEIKAQPHAAFSGNQFITDFEVWTR